MDDAEDRAPVFCDISAKLTMVGPLGLLVANCCIIRYLARIVTPHILGEDHSTARIRMLTDYALSFGFPALIAVLSVAVNLHFHHLAPRHVRYCLWIFLLCTLLVNPSAQRDFAARRKVLYTPQHFSLRAHVCLSGHLSVHFGSVYDSGHSDNSQGHRTLCTLEIVGIYS